MKKNPNPDALVTMFPFSSDALVALLKQLNEVEKKADKAANEAREAQFAVRRASAMLQGVLDELDWEAGKLAGKIR